MEELEIAAKVATSSSRNASTIAQALAKAVEEGGSEKFKLLVNALKPKLSSGLTKDTLKTALYNALNGAQQQIQKLVTAEFNITDPNKDITVNKPGGVNTVIVTIKKKPAAGGQKYHPGTATVKTSLTIEVKLDQNLPGISSKQELEKKQIATGIAQRLVKAARKAKAYADSDKEYNPGKELVEKEFKDLIKTAFGENGLTITVGESDKNVEVKIKKADGPEAADTPLGSATVKVKGSTDSKDIKITVKFDNELVTKDKAKAGKFGRLISRRIGQAMVDFQVIEAAKAKVSDITIEFDKDSKIEWKHSQ